MSYHAIFSPQAGQKERPFKIGGEHGGYAVVGYHCLRLGYLPVSVCQEHILALVGHAEFGASLARALESEMYVRVRAVFDAEANPYGIGHFCRGNIAAVVEGIALNIPA